MFTQRHSMRRILLPCILLVSLVHAGKPGQWQPAHCSSCEEGGTPAKQATCPASNPVSCSAITSDDYCCPSDNYCMWHNSEVVCCPEGCDCNEPAPTSSWAPAPTSSWAPAPTSWEPSTTWHSSWHATTTWHPSSSSCPPSSMSTTTTAPPASSTCDNCEWRPDNWNGVYCSTIFAHGPNLPTTAHAECGVVLVKQPSETVRLLIGWTKMITMIVGLQLLGGVLFVWR